MNHNRLLLSKKYVFNLQKALDITNVYFYFNIKRCVWINSIKSVQDFNLVEIEYNPMARKKIDYSKKMILFDKFLVNEEFKILRDIIFSDISLSIAKIFDNTKGVFSLNDKFINEMEESVNLPNIKTLCNTLRELKKNIEKKIKKIRNNIIAHHNNDLFEKNFLQISRFDIYPKENTIDIKEEVVSNLICDMLDCFILLQPLFMGCNNEVFKGYFCNIRFCKIFLHRVYKRKNKKHIAFDDLKDLKNVIEKINQLHTCKSEIKI